MVNMNEIIHSARVKATSGIINLFGTVSLLDRLAIESGL